jgi:glutamate N-acetyltransferase/amino-acid N-acetyltransferase
MSIRVPKGFRLAGLHAGVKKTLGKLDVGLIVSDAPAVAAGVYTQNLVFAAPVEWDRSLTPSDAIRAIAYNSGNANACTGERGLKDCQNMAKVAAELCGAKADQVLVLSTGIIGEFLPMDKVTAGIRGAAAQLADTEKALLDAANAILTTDTRHKLSGRSLTLSGREVQITGLAKGAGMIAPNMATMLGVIMTDAKLSAADAQKLLSAVVEDTFNCISVDGHMSTNDTVLLLANGAAGGPALSGNELKHFQTALHEVAGELAQAIPRDGEGATHFVTVDVRGCATRRSARQLAKTVAESVLVKTAITGADPNWGRIVSAAGYAGVPFDPGKVALKLNGFEVFRAGAPVDFDAANVSASMRENRDTHIELTFGEGDATARFWTTDLTAEFVRLNADYHS